MAERLLYYITDRTQFSGDEQTRLRSLLAKASDAARAGVDYIQLREKDLSARELEVLARETLSAICDAIALGTEKRQLKTKLLINSRIDVALAAGADGVHLRSEDVALADVRAVWSSCGAGALARVPTLVIAASCHTIADVLRAESEKADFAVFAPVFGKRSSAGTPPAGLAALREACHVRIPVFALGGVTLGNAASCLDAGAAGVAGIRLFQENKIEDVVRSLRAL
jgi:thiamine-phosphate pyrophosphorylase